MGKGSRVYLAGRLHTRRWEDAQTGEHHARGAIVLDDLLRLDRRGGASGAAVRIAVPATQAHLRPPPAHQPGVPACPPRRLTREAGQPGAAGPDLPQRLTPWHSLSSAGPGASHHQQSCILHLSRTRY